jgi:GNAT superfamily N-acetyltransferase
VVAIDLSDPKQQDKVALRRSVLALKIDHIFVEKKYQRRYVGKLLLADAIYCANAVSWAIDLLLVEVPFPKSLGNGEDRKSPAEKLFESMGFERLGKKSLYLARNPASLPA